MPGTRQKVSGNCFETTKVKYATNKSLWRGYLPSAINTIVPHMGNVACAHPSRWLMASTKSVASHYSFAGVNAWAALYFSVVFNVHSAIFL